MISVIIPCKNRILSLFDCLDSVLDAKKNAKYLFSALNCEIIIVNDHSDNGFVEQVIARYGNSVAVVNSTGVGPGYARNYGAQCSRGQYVFFTDSDCIVDKNWIANGFNRFQREKVKIIQGTPWLYQKKNWYGICEEKLYKLMFSRYINGNSSVMTDSRNLLFDRSVIESFGDKPFSEEQSNATAESRVFGKKCFAKGIPVIFDENVCVYHEDPRDLEEVCFQKYRHGMGRLLIWGKNQDFEELYLRYFCKPLAKGIPQKYVFPGHGAFLLGYYNNLSDKKERQKFLSFLQDVFARHGDSPENYAELQRYL